MYFWMYYDTRNFMEWIIKTQEQRDTKYFRYYPCIMRILIFPSKIWAKRYALYMAKCSIPKVGLWSASLCRAGSRVWCGRQRCLDVSNLILEVGRAFSALSSTIADEREWTITHSGSGREGCTENVRLELNAEWVGLRKPGKAQQDCNGEKTVWAVV